jgi:hypothetical protein
VPDVRVFGCGLAPARKVLATMKKTRRLSFADYLPLQRPWSWLFTGEYGGTPVRTTAPRIVRGLFDAMGLDDSDRVQQSDDQGSPRYIPELFVELPDYVQLVRSRDVADVSEIVERVPVSTVIITDLSNTDR